MHFYVCMHFIIRVCAIEMQNIRREVTNSIVGYDMKNTAACGT